MTASTRATAAQPCTPKEVHQKRHALAESLSGPLADKPVQQHSGNPASTGRAKLHEMHNDDGEIGWYFDCDGHYIDVERDENGKYSVYFRNRADNSEAWLDQADEPVAAPELDVEAERREEMVDAYLAFVAQGSYMSHPKVPYHGTDNGDSEAAWKRRYAAELIRSVLAARTAATSTAPAKEWISTSDRLPKPYEEVIVWPQPSDYCMTAEFYGLSASGNPVWKYGEYENGWGHSNVEITRPVTHWMPKPAAPSPHSPLGAKEQGK